MGIPHHGRYVKCDLAGTVFLTALSKQKTTRHKAGQRANPAPANQLEIKTRGTGTCGERDRRVMASLASPVRQMVTAAPGLSCHRSMAD